MAVLTVVRAQPQRAAGFALVAGGGLAVVIGGVAVSGSATPQEQMSYLVSAGIGGLLALVGGIAVLLDAGLRDERRQLAALAAAAGRPGPTLPSETRFGSGGRRPPLFMVALGAAAVGLGWNEAAAAADERAALPGLMIAIGGLVLALGGTTVRLLRAGATIRRGRAEVLSALAGRYRPAAATVDPGGPSRAPGADTVLVAPGLSRFHRAGCPTLAAVETTAVGRAAAAAGLRPCQLCEAGG
ncbi:MAG TPA: hypothetical protein VHL53_01850 [Acidimicrobiia bacterium]|nr:hypothetical protein [Acidimicrobiia bacterium]